MSLLDEVMGMQQQGISEGEIIENLQQQGISPGEINELLNQAQVKNAVAGEPFPEDNFEPVPQQETEMPAQEPQQEFYPQQDYQNYSQTTDTDTLIEIAGQVVEEKLKPVLKKLNEVNEFKVVSQLKLEHLESRLKRIEDVIDTIYSAVLNKVGAYGKDLENVKKELEMVEDIVKGKHKK